jgi:hypothetical protein
MFYQAVSLLYDLRIVEVDPAATFGLFGKCGECGIGLCDVIEIDIAGVIVRFDPFMS